MAKMLRAALFAGLAFWASQAQANPQVIAILKYTPRQPGIQIGTPTADEIARCEVKVVAGAAKGSSGYELRDPAGKMLRRFFDSNGDKKVDIWSYYKDGVEVYREIDLNGNDAPDHYRWLGSAGMKWGVDANEDGKIDAWRMISAEEAGQEALLALATNNFDRFRALLISEPEMKALKLSAKETDRLTSLQTTAQSKFKALLTKLPQLGGAEFERLENAAPSCIPADVVSEQDVIKFSSCLILYKNKDKHDLLETNEMIQVGYAWRFTDVPAPHAADSTVDVAKPGTNPDLQKLYDQLAGLDAKQPILGTAKPADVADYNLKRVAILQKLAPIEPDAKQREAWTKQIFDNLSTAYQAGSEPAMTHLESLCADLEKKDPAGNLTAYAAYRRMWGRYAVEINKTEPAKLGALQDQWFEKLGKFVQTFPKADDTPDALHQLAMGSEISGKDEEAKRWYQQIYTAFPTHAFSDKAKGAERRLSLVGREMELKGPLLQGPGIFDIAGAKGKVVVVYYWASNVDICKRDFDTLKAVAAAHGPKGLEIVTVNLDDSKDAALKFLAAHPLAAQHVGQEGEGGLSGTLATYYGINSMPTVIIIGRDGRVQNRTIQVNDLESALKKAL